ncbi:MAG TPA: thioredoxin domain-containing protein [Puia sp.]|uniref:vitamin K epoxide reductase family protein n=1 Tax=Puia sp. TaxID=2045100 RepID=UPI002BFA95E9|nr:thioredoxin domain-containing protein [Puia sp.]HVU98342.1 thioredoxin domain-containing protein [Puia sp.]
MVTRQLLRGLHINVTVSALKQTLEGHPDYPSLLSISDSLKKFNIANSCIRLGKEQLADIPLPFIAYTSRKGGGFLTVHSVGTDNVLCSGEKKHGGKRNIPTSEFIEDWNGICLLAEASPNSGEEDFRRRRIKEWLGDNTPALILLCCLIWMTLAISSWPLYLLTFIKFAGCFVASLLLWYDIDALNPVLQKICTAVKNTNCKAVIQSPAAKFFGLVSWSEIGFYYFAGSFLCLLVSPPAATVPLLSWINLLTLPYILFSVGYQWRVAKQWCLLCLCVQALLVAEFAAFYFLFWSKPSNHAPVFTVNTVAIFLIPVFFWTFSKTHLLATLANRRHKAELDRLKANKDIFQSMTQRQKMITADPTGLGITLGNPAAGNSIIKVCNPYCNPCAQAHPMIDQLLRTHDNLKVQIIFTAKDDDKDKKAVPVRHLMALYDKKDPELMLRALDDWYLAPEKDYQRFARKYPLNGELQKQGGKLQAMSEWCTQTGIFATPTIFVNGRQMPEIYSLGDLQSFLEE